MVQPQEKMSDNYTESNKRKKAVLITVIAVILAAAVGLVLFFVLRSKDSYKTPEEIAQEYLDASYAKDWKLFVDRTTDEALEVILEIDREAAERKGLTTIEELRTWASKNAYRLPDPMNGKAIGDYSVGEVLTMTPSAYIDDYLYGDTGNPYYSFIKSRDEIAVAKVNYTQIDGDEETERTDEIIMYKTDGRWYSTVGLALIHMMLLTVV
ncbi:MAG: hypothetical protein IKO61_09820 [Lachnospiraceae bacterium]|nr:hypothetical protein [Lachnospiraceae bacterium]